MLLLLFVYDILLLCVVHHNTHLCMNQAHLMTTPATFTERAHRDRIKQRCIKSYSASKKHVIVDYVIVDYEEGKVIIIYD